MQLYAQQLRQVLLHAASPAGSLPSIKDYKDRVRKAHQQQFEQPVFVDDQGTVGTVLEEDHPPTIATEPETGESQRSVNFAAQAAGAVVLSKNAEAKGSKHLLNDDDDKYFMSPCSDPTFVVVGLSEDCIVQQLIISNYERYSSTVKDFLLLGSQAYPTKEWMVLGNFTAADMQGEQSFDMQARKVWVRYVKLQWRSHYRDEYYCTMTQVAIHGQTIMQDLHDVVSPSLGEAQLEAPATATAPPTITPVPSAAPSDPVTPAETPNQLDPAPAMRCTAPYSTWRQHLCSLVAHSFSSSRTGQAAPLGDQAVAPSDSGTHLQKHVCSHVPLSSWAEHFVQLAADPSQRQSEQTAGNEPATETHGAASGPVDDDIKSSTAVKPLESVVPLGEHSGLVPYGQSGFGAPAQQPKELTSGEPRKQATWPHLWISCTEPSFVHRQQRWQSCLLHPRSGRPLLLPRAKSHAEVAAHALSQLNETLLRDLAANLSDAGRAFAAVLPADSSGAPAHSVPQDAAATQTPLPDEETSPHETGEKGHSSTASVPSGSPPSEPIATTTPSTPPAASSTSVPIPATSKGSPAQTLFKQLRSQVQDLELQQHALDAYLEDFRSAYDTLMGAVQTRLGNTTDLVEALTQSMANLSKLIPELQAQIQAQNTSIYLLQEQLGHAGQPAPSADIVGSIPLQQDTLQFYALLVVLSCAVSLLSCLLAAFALCCR